MKISLGTLQTIGSYIADQTARTQKLSRYTRKISVISAEDSYNIDVMGFPEHQTFAILSEPQTTVTRAYNVIETVHHKAPHHIFYAIHDEVSTPDTTYKEYITMLTLRHILERILSIDIISLTNLPPTLLSKAMKEHAITERCFAIFSAHIAHTYQEEHFQAFLYYVFQCNTEEQDKLLELYLTDIYTILLYMPSSLFKMLTCYNQYSTVSSSIRLFCSVPHTLRKKHIRHCSIAFPHIYPSYNTEHKPTYISHHIHAINPSPQYTHGIYYEICSHVPDILCTLCTASKTSQTHTYALIQLYICVLYYTHERTAFPITSLLDELYAEDEALMSYIRTSLSYDILAFATVLEYNNVKPAKEYIYEIVSADITPSLLLDYGIFWIRLFCKDNHRYSCDATYIMCSFLSSFSSITFSVFERLYILALCISTYHRGVDIALLFESNIMQEAIEHISDRDFTHLITTLPDIANKKSFVLLVQKRFIHIYSNIQYLPL